MAHIGQRVSFIDNDIFWIGKIVKLNQAEGFCLVETIDDFRHVVYFEDAEEFPERLPEDDYPSFQDSGVPRSMADATGWPHER